MTDPAEKAKAKQQAVKTLATYQKLIDGEPLLKKLKIIGNWGGD